MWDLIASVPDHCLSLYFTGGCHIPLTYAAIDRTLTPILFSFPNETSSVLR